MNTGLQTAQRTAYHCPAWCVRTDHDADVVGPDSPPMHYAPDVGAVGLQSDGFSAEAVVFLSGEGAYVSDPDELRRVAADMLAAADVLERLQRGES